MEKDFWKSKKFWAAVFGVLFAFAKQYGVKIPDEAIYFVMMYLGSVGLADIGKNKPKPEKPTEVK